LIGGLEFLERLAEVPDQMLRGLAARLTPGAEENKGTLAEQQRKLLGVARDSDAPIVARVEAAGEALKMQPAIAVEETVVRPLQEAPGRARDIGVHLQQAETAQNPVDKAIHTLEAVNAATDAFTGLATPAAVLSGRPSAGAVRQEVAPAGRTIRVAEKAAPEATSSIGRGQQIFREGEGLFIRGEQGEFVYAEGTLGNVAAPRDLKAQATLPGKLEGDQAGHALGARFGFRGGKPNLVPMAGRELNQSAYKKLENHLARLKAEGHDVKMEVWGIPGQNQLRPDRFFVAYSVDGKPASAVFNNPVPKSR
jgi:hypothetical protein